MIINKVGIIGLGFVGNAIYNSFKLNNINVYGYDKYKESDSFEDCLLCDFLFLCLPTLFNTNTNSYDLSSIIETCEKLNNYNGLVIIKSTIEPGTINILQNNFNKLKIIHNPEFLSAKTAFDDFHNQQHIVLGIDSNIDEHDIFMIVEFYNKYYPNAEISICSSIESESMKIFLNSFYSVKIQFFNELYLLSEKMGANYNNIVELMLKNKWINPMHTQVPGNDGKLSYGGHCFPKDTNALMNHMKRMNTPHMVLDATINERNKMRDDL